MIRLQLMIYFGFGIVCFRGIVLNQSDVVSIMLLLLSVVVIRIVVCLRVAGRAVSQLICIKRALSHQIFVLNGL